MENYPNLPNGTPASHHSRKSSHNYTKVSPDQLPRQITFNTTVVTDQGKPQMYFTLCSLSRERAQERSQEATEQIASDIADS
jgi:hypothetical protein